MSDRTRKIAALSMMAVLFACALPAAADEALDKAFEALKTLDWGMDLAPLKPIDAAVVGTYKDAAAQKSLQVRLVAILKGDSPRAAKDYACRQLSLVRSDQSVPALAALLPDAKLSHLARFALERIPSPAATKAMRDALGTLKGTLKIGVINSLGVRRDAASTPALTALLGDSDKEIVAAAATALGNIATPPAAKALGAFQAKAPEALKLVAADAYLVCAEGLLADGKKADAMTIYKALSKSKIKHVRLGAMRGLLAAAGKKK